MYEIFELLCEKRGITTYRFCKDTGVNSSTISTWKNRNTVCNLKLAEKIAKYFMVSVDYVMTGKQPEHIEEFGSEEWELIELYSKLKEGQKTAVMNLLRSFTLET